MGKISLFLISREEDKEMEKELIRFISLLLFSGTNTHKFFLNFTLVFSKAEGETFMEALL